ncbi:MAG TPA: glycosyltransferase family 2 protein [Polyangiaceae bacterium]|nr:glycosyltransferase family 2 protein [Polyangiaceae bacterium]
MWQGAKVAVVIPAFNEERLIGRTLSGIPSFVDTVYVVDDASSDQTTAAVVASGDARVRTLRHADNRGVGAAIATGYRAALADGHAAVAVMAGDNQMHPGDLSSLVDVVASGRADYAKGNRFDHPRAHDMPAARRLGGRLLSLLTRWATGLAVGDTQCGYTVIGADALRVLPLDELWPRYGYPNDLLALLAAHGMRVVEIPVRPVYAGEASGVRAWHVLSIGALIGRRWLRTRSSRRGAKTTDFQQDRIAAERAAL